MHLIFSLLFLVVILEYFYVNEDILFIISFVIFFYNVVNIVAGFLVTELENRKTIISELIKLNLSLNKNILILNLFLCDFLDNQDFEKDLSLISFILLNTASLNRNSSNVEVDADLNYMFAEDLDDSLFELYALELFE